MSKESTKIGATIAAALIVGWITWVSKTLIDMKSEIAVLNFRVLKVARLPPPNLLGKEAPSLAFPILPIPNAWGLTPKEDSNALKPGP